DNHYRRAHVPCELSERCSRLHDARGADGKEQIAVRCRFDGSLKSLLGQLLTKPDDIWTQHTTAAWTARRNLASTFPGVQHDILVETFCACNVAVQFYNIMAACALVQTIHVLCDQSECWHMSLNLHQCQVSRVGRYLGSHLAPFRVPFPHKARIAPERLGRG